MPRALLAAVLCFLAIAVPASAGVPVPQLMMDRLKAGETALLEQDLTARLAATPNDDEVRFALGTTEFLRTVELMSQDMYRYGLQTPRDAAALLPFLRFPLPVNPRPEKLDYEKMRAVFQRALSGFEKADATLAGLGAGEVKLPLEMGLVRLDLNGDGKAEDQETLFALFNATMANNHYPATAAPVFVVAFDRGDASWLRGYCNLLSALIDFLLAHDFRSSFDVSAQAFFPHSGLPLDVLNQNVTPGSFPGVADMVAAVHLMHWPVTDQGLMTSALAHLETTVAMSRESWRFILAETDDDREWIPAPRQKYRVMANIPLTQETVDGWMLFLSETEQVLQGRKLIPHWRFSRGLNLRRMFLEPGPFDPVLLIQGSAALPYLEDGPTTDFATWNRMMTMFGGNFFWFAVWFN